MVDFGRFAAADAADAQDTVDTIVRCVLLHADPELVLLFGSRAWGSARDQSDYDLMVVLRDEEDLAASANAIRRALSGIGICADVLTRSVAQYGRQQQDPGFLDFVVSRKGRLLYTTERIPQLWAGNSRVRERPPREGLAMWVRRADSDLRAAEQLLSATDPVADATCFHAHACVEKMLKAIVVRAGAFPPRTHELAPLLEMQSDDISHDERLARACDLLMRLLPGSRYPEVPEPTLDEAQRAVAAARLVRSVLGDVGDVLESDNG